MLPRPRRPRTGFTLLELLVVIAIISILTSLIMAGVMKGREAAVRTETFNEIKQLELSVAQFQTKLKVDYIPSKLILIENAAYGSSQLEIDSERWLRTCWPNLKAGAMGVDWNGDGTTGGSFTLEGDQVLVWALGGPAQQGFSTNPSNPANPLTGGNRVGPFYTFPTNRLFVRSGGPANCPSFADNWSKNDPAGSQQPYVYFSSYGKSQGYSRYGSSDCAGLGVSPYSQSAGKYWNEKGFQIISAGKDRQFGAGGNWPPGDAATADNQSNLSKALMATGPN